MFHYQDPNLPCGVTQAMCEGNDDPCGSCGHLWSEHLDEDQYEYNSDGEVVMACNIEGCDSCTGFSDDEYEPDWDSMNENLD